jgi:transposase
LPIFDPKKCYNNLSSPYSPDLSPPDYFLFPKLKMRLKGIHFADVAEIQKAITDELKKVKKRNFWQLFRNWGLF